MQYNGQTLAYLGDAVYELMIRQHLLEKGVTKPAILHQEAVKWTSAKGQFEGFKKIEDQLSQDELDVIKRGRNTTLSRKARNTDLITYHYATGLEALFGYLHLHNQTKRIGQLIEKMTKKTI